MIKYTKEEIDNLKLNYKINDQLIERLKIIKKEMNKSSHITINNKTNKEDKTENLKKIIIFLNKISYENYKDIINNLNIVIDNKEDLIEIIKIIIYNSINYYNIQCNTINNENIYMYSDIIYKIIKNRYKWYYKDKEIYTFRYILIDQLEKEYDKIKKNNDKKVLYGYYILITTLYIKNILSDILYEKILDDLINSNNNIINELLIYILKLLLNNNINKYYEKINNILKKENDQRINIIYKILINNNNKINNNNNNNNKNIKINDSKSNIDIKKVLEDNIYNKDWNDFIEIYKEICKNKVYSHKIDDFLKLLEENLEEIKIDIPNINIKELKIIFKR